MAVQRALQASRRDGGHGRILLHTERAYAGIVAKLRAVYTFGQPMVGDERLAARADAADLLAGKMIRYVFGRDVVAQLPPRASGAFAHFGREFRHASNERPGEWHDSQPTTQMRSLLELTELLPSFLACQLRATRSIHFPASIDDHLPQHYIATLTPPGVRTEFGN